MFDERSRFLAGNGACFAFAFAALSVVFVSQQISLLHPALHQRLLAVPGLADALWALSVMIVIGLGYLHRRQFGRTGRLGLLRSCLATGDIAVLTAALIGLLVMPLDGAMYGPLLLILALADQPEMAILPGAAATLGHVAAASVRARYVSL